MCLKVPADSSLTKELISNSIGFSRTWSLNQLFVKWKSGVKNKISHIRLHKENLLVAEQTTAIGVLNKETAIVS